MADIEGFPVPGWLITRERKTLTPPVYDLLTADPASRKEAAQLTLEAALTVMNRNGSRQPLILRREVSTTGHVGQEDLKSYPQSFGLGIVPEGHYGAIFTADGNRRNSTLTYEILHGAEWNPKDCEIVDPQSVVRLVGQCVKGEVEMDYIEFAGTTKNLPFHKVAGAILAWNAAGSSVVDLGNAEREALNRASGLTKDQVWKDQTGAIVDPPF